jgi:hypothetical protein
MQQKQLNLVLFSRIASDFYKMDYNPTNFFNPKFDFIRVQFGLGRTEMKRIVVVQFVFDP